MVRNNVFPLNSLEYDPNLRGEAPFVMQLVDISGTLVAGIFATDDIPSPILGADALGAIVLSNNTAGGEVLGAKVEAGASGAGYIKVTLSSSDVTSTTAVTAQALVVGRINPVQV